MDTNSSKMKDMKYVHRDINWCDFNARVLSEAKDPSVPLLDKIKFLAIFSSNLDEFFRVKIAALHKLQGLKKNKASKWLGFSPKELLEKIYAIVSAQQNEFGRIWSSEVLPMIEQKGIHLYQTEEVLRAHIDEIKKYFRVSVQGYLNIVITKQNKKIELKNRSIYLIVNLLKRETGEQVLGYVNIPSQQMDRYKMLSSVDGVNYCISLDDVIRINLSTLFSDYEIQGRAYSIKLNRDEDYEIEDEFSGNLVEKIKEKINKRMDGDPVRFLYDSDVPVELLKKIQKCCGFHDLEKIAGGRYHNLSELFQLADLLGHQLKGQGLSQIPHKELEKAESVLRAMEEKDLLLHYPYHDYNNVLRFFNEAAVDPSVKEIKVTLYRISKKSQIAQTLISAAQNGKKVTVFVEVKARYDELNNLQWAKEMEHAGVSIIYSIPGLKVHAKVALVVRQNASGKKIRYAYLATGNFNEKTALLYADHGLFTTNKEITKELESLFDFLKTRSKSIEFKSLLVAGFNMKQRLLELIDQEIEAARNQKEASIIIKVNGLDERDVISKLYEASQAGVKVQLIVRAGCSLVPGIAGVSENISAYRLVDMYLEHARVYWFCNKGEDKIFLSSADWMNRNLNRRIEAGFPIIDEGLKEEIKHIIKIQLSDTAKLTPINLLDSNHNQNGTSAIRAQLVTHEWLAKKESVNLTTTPQ